MVSVRTEVPLLADGGVDHLQWCARIGQAHELDGVFAIAFFDGSWVI